MRAARTARRQIASRPRLAMSSLNDWACPARAVLLPLRSSPVGEYEANCALMLNDDNQAEPFRPHYHATDETHLWLLCSPVAS
eukprot:209945-Amphidinium_carterae.1